MEEIGKYYKCIDGSYEYESGKKTVIYYIPIEYERKDLIFAEIDDSLMIKKKNGSFIKSFPLENIDAIKHYVNSRLGYDIFYILYDDGLIDIFDYHWEKNQLIKRKNNIRPIKINPEDNNFYKFTINDTLVLREDEFDSKIMFYNLKTDELSDSYNAIYDENLKEYEFKEIKKTIKDDSILVGISYSCGAGNNIVGDEVIYAIDINSFKMKTPMIYSRLQQRYIDVYENLLNYTLIRDIKSPLREISRNLKDLNDISNKDEVVRKLTKKEDNNGTN